MKCILCEGTGIWIRTVTIKGNTLSLKLVCPHCNGYGDPEKYWEEKNSPFIIKKAGKPAF